MKKTQVKDNRRNITKQIVSYISIIVIAMLGVAVFLGLDYSAVGLKRNGAVFFAEQDFRDIEMISTLLFTDEDLADIRGIEGVADVEKVWQVSGRASSGGDRTDVNVISLTERMNRPALLEGRLPETATECAVEKKLADKMGWTLGSEIRVEDAAGATVEYLKGNKFTLTGIANHPEHGNTLVTNVFYLMVTPEAFDREALDGGFMKAEIAIEKDPGVDRFSEGYRSAAAAVADRLEALSLSGSARRESVVRDQYQTRLAEGERELDDAQAQLTDARTQLDDGWKALAEGEQELKDAQAQLDSGKQELDDAWKELENAKPQLEEAERQLREGKSKLDEAAAQLGAAQIQLDNGKAQLISGWNTLESSKAQIRAGIRSAVENAIGSSAGFISWASSSPVDVDNPASSAMYLKIASGVNIYLGHSLSSIAGSVANLVPENVLLDAYKVQHGTEDGFDVNTERANLTNTLIAATGSYGAAYEALHNGCAQWDAGQEEYLVGLDAYNKGYAEYEQGYARYMENYRPYQEARAKYDAGMEQYNQGRAAYEKGLADYADGQRKWEESRDTLNAGEQEYADGLARWQDGARKLDNARRQLESLNSCRWLILDMNGNPGYIQVKTASDNLVSLEGTFALLFVLVGALVIFATVSKMVDEQRTLVGTTKALGFFNREIAAKYLSFGVSAAVLGAVLGILVSVFVMEKLVLGGYGIYYTFNMEKPVLTVLPTVAVLLASAALSVVAVWAATTRLLRTPAIRLMQAQVPQGAKKSKSGKSSLSLYSRLILLNIRTDIKRVIVTVVSVAGCCALVVIGVGLKQAMVGSLSRQYDEIVDYDFQVNFSSEESVTAEQDVEAVLRSAGTEYMPLYKADVTFQIPDIQTAELFVTDIQHFGEFYHLRDWKTGEAMADTDEGLLIQRRVAEIYGLDRGSEFNIALGGVREGRITVAGVFEHFVGRPMVMTPAYFERVFAQSYAPNAFLVRLNGADAAAVEESLRSVKGFVSVTASDTGKTTFKQSTGVINALVVLFIGMAAVMAAVVQMNLTNIYVMQKKRELTIMRINGFSVKEVIRYMSRETILTTILGILLGLALGSGINYQIVRSLEQAFLQFDRRVSLPALLAGVAVTALFTVAVNIIALKPVKNLKLTDV